MPPVRQRPCISSFLPQNNFEKLNIKECMDEQKIKGKNNLTYFMISILFDQLRAIVWCLKFK